MTMVTEQESQERPERVECEGDAGGGAAVVAGGDGGGGESGDPGAGA